MDIREFYSVEGETPLDNLKRDGGFFGIFRTAAVIGDSLSSGEMESFANGASGYHDYYEYSWGKYMERAAGNTVHVFARGGMTASEYLASFAEANGFFSPDLAAQAYIIALGVNDYVNAGQPLGSACDIDLECPENNPATFAGNMGRIISRYLAIEPKARFFLVTMPKCGDAARDAKSEDHAKLLREIAEKLPFTYVIDLFEYAPMHDAEYRRNFYLGGHLNAAGYMMTAWQVMTYIDYIIRSKPEDFTQAAFIGRGGVHNEGYKW